MFFIESILFQFVYKTIHSFVMSIVFRNAAADKDFFLLPYQCGHDTAGNFSALIRILSNEALSLTFGNIRIESYHRYVLQIQFIDFFPQHRMISSPHDKSDSALFYQIIDRFQIRLWHMDIAVYHFH